MRIYNNQEEVEKDLVNWVLKVDDDITFNFDLEMNIDILAKNIYGCKINCNNIKAENIQSGDIYVINIHVINMIIADIEADNIKAKSINAVSIITKNIHSYNIHCYEIKADNVYAYDIIANRIDAYNINYYAVCIAYETFKYKNIKGRRQENSKHICLDWEIEIIWKEKST